MLHVDKYKNLTFPPHHRILSLSKKILSGFVLTSLFLEINIFVSYSKYRVIRWLWFSNHEICGVSFLRIAALDFAVEREQAVFLGLVILPVPSSPFPFPFLLLFLNNSTSRWGRAR